MVRRLPRAVAEIRDQQSAHFRARVASEVAGTPEVFVKWELVRKTFSRLVQTRFLKRCGATVTCPPTRCVRDEEPPEEKRSRPRRRSHE